MSREVTQDKRRRMGRPTWGRRMGTGNPRKQGPHKKEQIGGSRQGQIPHKVVAGKKRIKS